MHDSILNKALEFLGEPVASPLISEPELQRTHSYAQKTEGVTNPLLKANLELAEEFPNLVFSDDRADEVTSWLGGLTHVALDIETHGQARLKPQHKKEALSFARGTIRLAQLSGGPGNTYTLDCAMLDPEVVSRILGALKGKSIYGHNTIFDLPRLLRNFGVDLLDEDIRDTLILSRLLRAGQWDLVSSEGGGTATVTKKHDIGSVLLREIGVEIPKETDHRWGEPLTADRLRYAIDDVVHLVDLYRDLHEKVEDAGLGGAYRLIKKVHPIYMRQQARGVPFDAELYEEMRAAVAEKLELLESQLAEHAPEHPEAEEGGEWVWRNFNKPEDTRGRNGILRALALAGTPLPDTRKHTRLAYLKKNKEARLLSVLDQYLRYADLESDTKGWLDLYYEDGRLYPNVQFFSQVTGRSAYSNPALQNIAKHLDLPGLGGASFRDCVRVPEGRSIIKADYSAQELRILAYVTGDENLKAAFADQAAGGKDPHLRVGEIIAGKELEKGTPEGDAYRQAGKRANYGFSYGAGWRRYQRSIYEDTAEFIGDKQAMQEKWAFEEAWPEVKRWQEAFGDRGGHEPDAWYTTSFLGRRRYVGRGTKGAPNYCDRLNGPIQQGGADQLYLALARMLDDPMEDVFVIITTHDEVVLECPEDLSEDAALWLTEHMREAVRQTIGEDLATEDCVEAEISASWGRD
jgi:DNA polymerase I-like protein with 3'-5' exonuclease and polymerase domains